MLGALVLGLAAAIFLIRRSSSTRATQAATVQPPASER
jgi:F0F1-type ATP synthase assembly protein I